MSNLLERRIAALEERAGAKGDLPRLPAIWIIYDPRDHPGEDMETVCKRLEAEERARTNRHDNMLIIRDIVV